MPQPTAITVHQQEPEPVFVHRHPSIHRIIGVVCERYEVSRTELLSQRRSFFIVRPRQIAMYLAREMTRHSLPEIGRRMGDRDHTTIMHGVKKIARLRPHFPQLDEELTALETILGGNNEP